MSEVGLITPPAGAPADLFFATSGQATLASGGGNAAGLLPALRELSRRAGVTRVAHVTGLDRIGIPVVMAIRPNARSVSVAMGKALQADDAEISAVMEAIEGYHAETVRPALAGLRYTELPPERRLRCVDMLMLDGVEHFDRSHPIRWSEGVELMSGRQVAVPFDLVHTDYTRPTDGAGLWPGSNGLASGSTRQGALVAAIAEVIERDAIAHWLNQPPASRNRYRVDLDSVTDPRCRQAIAQLQRGGMTVCCWDVTSDIGVPVFACRLIENARGRTCMIGPVRGAGCHLDPAVALLRALTEAAQIRLTYIVGARDDLDPYEYGTCEDREIVAWAEEAAAKNAPRLAFRQAEPVDDPVDVLLGRLAGAGVAELVAVDLTREEFGIPVVRAIAPGMGGLTPSGKYRPGLRRPADRVLPA